MEVGDEVQRRELDQHVEADVAFDAEAGGGGVERRPRPELHRVGGDGEVGLAQQARVGPGAQRDGHALERGHRSRLREARIEPAD